MKLCWVELRDYWPVRIFRNRKDALKSEIDGLPVAQVTRSVAVGLIRRQVIKRADGECQQCGRQVGTNGHMHEKKLRSLGGEISLENSILLCADCHIGDNSYSAHSDRRLGGKR